MREVMVWKLVMWTARLRILFHFRLENNDLPPNKLHRDRNSLQAMSGIQNGCMGI